MTVCALCYAYCDIYIKSRFNVLILVLLAKAFNLIIINIGLCLTNTLRRTDYIFEAFEQTQWHALCYFNLIVFGT